jgi:hypothetical protein
MPLHPLVDIPVESFRKFASSLKNIDMEKWVLVFCQRSVTLLVNPSSSESTSIASEPTDALQEAGSFFDFFRSHLAALRPLVKFRKAEMERMFIQSGATFHLLVLPSHRKDDPPVPGLSYQEEQTGWQDVFAAISSATGGIVLQEKDMAAAVQEFSRQEDVYYMLTFDPGESSQPLGKLKLETQAKDYDIYYDNEGVAPRVGTLAIQDLIWQEPLLKMRMRNYALDLTPQGIAGRVSLTLRVQAQNGQSWTSTRELILPEKKPEIEMKLHFPQKGRYHLTLEAVDRLEGSRCETESKILWRGNSPTAVQAAAE